jgi:DNA-binding transcriptional LysR family regulator
LHATENGQLFYDGAKVILQSIDDAEARVAEATSTPRGTVFVAAPLGAGRRFIAPNVPAFNEAFPQIDVRLRLSDRIIDVTTEGLDMAFHLGPLVDSDLKVRVIADCPRVVCASPSYLEARGEPKTGADLISQKHDCLNLRFPGALEFQWPLITPEGPRRFQVTGPFESDDGDVLTQWALDGQGLILKPLFEVAEYIDAGRLRVVAKKTPPTPTQLACLTPSRKMRDAKVSAFSEFMIARCKAALAV